MYISINIFFFFFFVFAEVLFLPLEGTAEPELILNDPKEEEANHIFTLAIWFYQNTEWFL